MSDWYDENDEPLGRWVPCSTEEYEAIRFNESIDWAVFAARTIVGNELRWGRDIYTEWGRRGDAAPLAACHDVVDHFGEPSHTHMRFVLAGDSDYTPKEDSE